jgi:hypothetical protein
MLFAPHRLAQAEFLSKHLFRLLVFAPTPWHRQQVGYGYQDVMMQYRTHLAECLSKYLSHLLILALTARVRSCSMVWMDAHAAQRLFSATRD